MFETNNDILSAHEELVKGITRILKLNSQMVLSASLTDIYYIIGIFIGVMLIVGAGGLFGLIQWIKKSGARDAKIDELLDSKTGVMARLDEQDKTLSELQHSVKPNGLDTNQVGDIAKRTENAVREIAKKQETMNERFLKHLGQSDEVHKRHDEAHKQNEEVHKRLWEAIRGK